MLKFNSGLLLLICIPTLVKAQLKTHQICLLKTSSGVLVQQVDDKWNKLPFDCQNIEIEIQSEFKEWIIKPGELYDCQYPFLQLQNRAVEVIGEQPGVYSISIKRFDEVNHFKNVKVEWDETGCDVIAQVLEVQFDIVQNEVID